MELISTNGKRDSGTKFTSPEPGADLVRDDQRFSNAIGILQKKTMWFIGVEVQQETSAPPPKKNPGSAPVNFENHLPKP